MFWNRFQFAVVPGFVLASALLLLGAPACGPDAQPAPMAGAGQPATPSAAGGGAGGAAGAVSGAGAASGGAPGAGAGAVAGAAGALPSAGAAGNAGTGSASSPCHARSGLLFCDDFEESSAGAALGAPWSSALIGEGTVAVEDNAFAHSGSKSVHVHGAEFQTLLVYHDPAVLPQASGKLYVRAFVRLAEAMVGGHNTFVIADLFASPGTGNALRVGEMNGMLMMTVNGDTHGWLSNQNFYNDQKPGVSFKAAGYSCLELLLDAPHTEIEVWVDGVDVPDLHITDIALENYDALRFGFEKYAGPVSDIWYDDIAVGTERIGCD